MKRDINRRDRESKEVELGGESYVLLGEQKIESSQYLIQNNKMQKFLHCIQDTIIQLWRQLACSCTANLPVLELEDGPVVESGHRFIRICTWRRVLVEAGGCELPSLETRSDKINVPGRQGCEKEHSRQHT